MRSLIVLIILTLISTTAYGHDTAESSNRTGLELMAQVAAQGADQGNLVVSPISYYLNLAMSYNGTAAETQTQLARWLGVKPGQVGTFDQDTKAFLSALRVPPSAAAGDGPLPPTVDLFTSAWANTATSAASGGTFHFPNDYVTEIKNTYDAEVGIMDFNQPATVQAINDWAMSESHGLIPSIIDAESLSPLFWVLLSATAIQAYWDAPFSTVTDPTHTRFTAIGGADKAIDAIEREGTFNVAQTDDYTAVELPFAQSDLALFVIVPEGETQFKAMQSTQVWTPGFWHDVFFQLVQKEAAQDAHVILPKFDFHSSFQLKDGDPLTQAVGLQFLFEDSANFTALSAPGSLITKMGLLRQEARISLDENGLSAAAIGLTGGMEVTSAPANPPILISADHPFFFAVGSKVSGAILFAGSIVDPTLQ